MTIADLAEGFTDVIDPGTGTSGPPGLEATLEFNTLILNDRKLVDTYLITNIDGLGDPDVRDSREVNPGRHGETPYNAYYGGRTIVLTGTIRAHTLNKLRDMQTALKWAFADLSQEYPLIFHPRNATYDVQINCKKSQSIVMAEIQQNQFFTRDFQVTLRASNPRFLSTTTKTSVITFGFTDDFSSGTSLSANWTTDSGTSSIASGTLRPVSTSGTEFRAYASTTSYVRMPYQRVSMKFTTPATMSTGQIIGVFGHRIDANTAVIGQITMESSTAARLAIVTRSGGTYTTQVQHASTQTLSASTAYSITLNARSALVDATLFNSGGTVLKTVSWSPGSAPFNADMNGAGGIRVAGTVNTNTWLLDDFAISDAGYYNTLPYATVTNNGDLPAEPLIRVYGYLGADDPGSWGLTIHRGTSLVADTSQMIRVLPAPGTAVVVPSGRYLELNTTRRTCKEYTNAGVFTRNAYAQVGAATTWLELVPGTTTIWIGTYNNMQGHVDLMFQDTWI